MHKRLFCMISVMMKSPHSASSVSNAVCELQQAALNDLMTALLRKFSATQACTDVVPRNPMWSDVVGTSQLVTRSTRHTVKWCAELTVVSDGVVTS